MESLFDIQNKKVLNEGIYFDTMNNIMNGIAYRKETNSYLISGKMWNYIFEVQFF